MRYTIRHVTRFTYEAPISESVMEVRMQPRSDGLHRCLYFAVTTSPASRVLMHQDHDGNIVHHFNIPARHARMSVTADALVECQHPAPALESLDGGDWAALDDIAASGDLWEFLSPGSFTQATPLLTAFMAEASLQRGHDPLSTLGHLMTQIYSRFAYSPSSTRVDSPIDDALQTRRGVCQDFAHIFIAVARQLGIPTRYVSGYLFHDPDSSDRAAEGATHAWAESLVPGAGWIGFDPTNDAVAGERHIRAAIGRDYADVPPTRGVYKGASHVKSDLAVSVRVGTAPSSGPGEVVPFTPWMSRDAMPAVHDPDAAEAQRQQQQ